MEPAEALRRLRLCREIAEKGEGLAAAAVRLNLKRANLSQWLCREGEYGLKIRQWLADNAKAEQRLPRREVRRRLEALAAHRFVAAAARELGVPYPALYKWQRDYLAGDPARLALYELDELDELT